jgi:hypothetical protein
MSVFISVAFFLLAFLAAVASADGMMAGTKNASEERGLSDWMEQLNPINTSVGYNILLILL